MKTALALVRDMRELREPSSGEEVADFEAGVLAGFDDRSRQLNCDYTAPVSRAARNQMPKLGLSEARRLPATAMMSFSSWQSTMMAK